MPALLDSLNKVQERRGQSSEVPQSLCEDHTLVDFAKLDFWRSPKENKKDGTTGRTETCWVDTHFQQFK